MAGINLHFGLILLSLMYLGLVVAAPVQKVITNHCDAQDCEINVEYHDNSYDISLQTTSNDSVLAAFLDINIQHDDSSDHNDLVNLMGNIVQMLSSMMQSQHDNHQQLDNMVQQLNIQTSPEPAITTRPNVEVTNEQPAIETSEAPMVDCTDARSSGIYNISPVNAVLNAMLVVCDVHVDENQGGWIVIQRRFDGSVDFDRYWSDYENGFGSLDGEFWLGLSKMHSLTSNGTWKLRFDMEDFDENHAHAEYDFFQVGDSASNYQLTIGSYTGTAGDSMVMGEPGSNHNLNRMPFTTKDRDNDNGNVNCGIHHGSGWWHSNCAASNPNGVYLGEGGKHIPGMVWWTWKQEYALKKIEMKIKRGD